MNILYISNFVDDKYFLAIFDKAKEKPMQNMQKFNKLLVTGISQNEKVNRIDILTTAPVNRTISDKYFFKGKNVKEGKIKFKLILYFLFVVELHCSVTDLRLDFVLFTGISFL